MKRITLQLITLMTVLQVNAQQDIADKFAKGTHSHQGETLPYRFFTPGELEEGKKYPLVIALHGGGSRGTDNKAQMELRMATVWADTMHQKKYPCYVLVPQCSEASQWKNTSTLQVAIHLLDSLIAHHPIDTSRLYITGQSMGARGTWKAISDYPGKFAAAVILAGDMNTDFAHFIGNTPIWNFHGTRDPVVLLSGSRDIFQILEEELGRIPFIFRDLRTDNYGIIEQQLESHQDLLYAELFGRAHDIWAQSYDYPYLLPWVFSKTLRRENSLDLHTVEMEVDTVNIQWHNSYPEDSVELWFSHDNGTHWDLIASGLIDTTYSVSKYELQDCFAGIFRIIAKDSAQWFYSSDEYRNVRIDTERNGLPYVKITNDDLLTNFYIRTDVIDLELLVNDTEDNDLSVKVYISSDKGETYTRLSEFNTPLITEPISALVYLSEQPDSYNTIIKVTVSDGEAETSDSTYTFSNSNEYDPNGILDWNSGARIYPNPSSEHVSIDLPNYDHVEVYDLKGTLLNASREPQLDLAGYRDGIYILRLFDQTGSMSIQKFIVQKK